MSGSHSAEEPKPVRLAARQEQVKRTVWERRLDMVSKGPCPTCLRSRLIEAQSGSARQELKEAEAAHGFLQAQCSSKLTGLTGPS